MERFTKTVEAISQHSGKWVSWVIYVGIIFLSLEVVLRYVFNSPTVWAHGYTQRLFGSYFVLIGAYTFVNNGHVRVDVIHEHVSPKMRIVLDIVNCLFLLLWSGVMIPVSWVFFMNSYSIGEVDEMVLAHPIWWVKFIIVVGMALIFLQGLSEMLKKISELFGRKSTSGNLEKEKV
jgi:TRAP-type mannitol/chloroaromatic compound transport system permease small subunit